MATSPDSVTYSQTIAEVVAPEVAPDWSNVARPDQPQLGMFGVARETSLFEFWDGTAWRNPIWASGGTFTGAVTFSAGFNTLGASTCSFGSNTGGPVTIAPGTASTSGTLAFNGGGGLIAVAPTKTLILGNTATGTVNVNLSPLTVTRGTQTVAGAITPIINTSVSMTGTATGNPQLAYTDYQFTVQSDNVALPVTDQFLNGFQLQHNYGGAAMTGNRQAMQVNLVQTATTGNVLAGSTGFYVAFQSYSTTSTNDNGSGLTGATAHGRVFGGGMAAQLHSGATNYYQACALELNTQVDTGASTLVRSFLSVASVAGAVQGTLVDAGIWFYGGSGARLKHGILFGSGTLNNWSIDAAGTIIGADGGGGVSAAAAYGVDFSAVTFSTAFLKSVGFLVDPAGNTSALTYQVSGTQVVGARNTGWSAMTGSTNKATVYDTSTVTLAQLAGRVMALQAALTAHGLIGT